MQIGTVSRLRFCKRSWGLNIYFWRNIVCLWSHTFVPISWMCKKQTSVSHSSTESEISLDAGLWDLIVAVLVNTHQNGETRCWTNVKFVLHFTRFTNASNLREWSMIWIMLIFFPHTSNLLIRKRCCMCLKTTNQWSRWSLKGRSLAMRHVSRTHRVAVDCLFDGIYFGLQNPN